VFRGVRALFALPLLTAALAACLASVDLDRSSSATLSADTVATGAEDALEKEVGQRPDVTCPQDLEAKVGATTRCTLTAEGATDEYGVTVTVRSVENGTAHFDVEVDPQPQG
jgi:Domain of unknown function (DUF4333)